MKVLHVIPSISPLLGGPTQVVLNLVRALRAYGVDAEIATTNDHGSDVLNVPVGQQVMYEGVPVWFFPRASMRMKEFLFSAELTRWLWQHSREYDILDNHYLFSYASTCAGAIARWQNIPYTVRTIGHLHPWALQQSQLKKQLYLTLIERHNLNRAAAIHCTSAAEAEDVRRFGITVPTITLPLGIHQVRQWLDAKQHLRQRYQIPANTPIVLFLSRLHYKKSPDLLIAALGQLASQKVDFHLILAGAGDTDYLTYLSNLLDSLNLATKAAITGFIAGPDKDLLLQGADLFVLPSLSENFGIAVAEAMAAGLPVIVTPDVQIATDIQTANAGLVVQRDRDSLAAAIAQLLANPELRTTLGKNGKKFAHQHYDWNAIAQKLTLAYTEILQKKPLLQVS